VHPRENPGYAYMSPVEDVLDMCGYFTGKVGRPSPCGETRDANFYIMLF